MVHGMTCHEISDLSPEGKKSSKTLQASLFRSKEIEMEEQPTFLTLRWETECVNEYLLIGTAINHQSEPKMSPVPRTSSGTP
jgi:hypothetical protein